MWRQYTLVSPLRLYLLPLLDGGHSIWLELQLVGPTQFPVENGEDDEDDQKRDHNPNDYPHICVLSVGGWRRHFFYSCKQK